MQHLPDKAAALGRALRRIDDRIVRQDGAGRMRRCWYQGPELYLDVFFEEGTDGLSWFQATLRGRALTWEASRGFVVTGHTNELEASDPLRPASKAILSGPGSDRAVIEVVHAMFAARAGEAPFDSGAAILARWLEACR